MKIFIDIGHPAHVHYFKNLIHEMTSEGAEFIITARNKEVTQLLLQKEGIPFTTRGTGNSSFIGKAIYTIKADYQLFKIAYKEKPDLFLSFASPYCAHVSKLMGKPHIAIDDTETAKIGQTLYRPFTDTILTPETFDKDFGKKHIRFPSYIEFCYLHPKRFKPDPSIYSDFGIEKGEKYIIMRFVAWTANHDFGQKGISLEKRTRAVEEFSRYAKVFISSESELPESLKKYQIRIPPERIHHALAYASLLYGESGTMATESAVLGTPSIFINDLGLKLGILRSQAERYKLINIFTESEEDQIKSIEKGVEILTAGKGAFKGNHKRFIADNIDMTGYLVDFVKGYFERA